jgi:hypothetical protein
MASIPRCPLFKAEVAFGPVNAVIITGQKADTILLRADIVPSDFKSSRGTLSLEKAIREWATCGLLQHTAAPSPERGSRIRPLRIGKTSR